MNLSSAIGAGQLRLDLGIVPTRQFLSYRDLVALLIALAALSVLRARGRPTDTTRAVGVALIALAVVFVLTTRLLGGRVLFLVGRDANAYQVIEQQLTGNPDYAPPASFFGVSLDPTTTLLLDQLRAGWAALLLAGAVLAGRLPVRRWLRPFGRVRLAAAAPLALASLLLLVSIGAGALAEHERSLGIGQVEGGSAAPGLAALRRALSLDPDLAWDTPLELAEGQAEADLGMQTPLAEFAVADRPAGDAVTVLEQVQDFEQALGELPSSGPAAAVVRASFDAMITRSIGGRDAPRTLGVAATLSADPSVAYTLGHYDYQHQQFAASNEFMLRAAAATRNDEVRSWALTYAALAEQRLGNEQTFRDDIVTAVIDDREYANAYADEIASGLYVPGSP